MLSSILHQRLEDALNGNSRMTGCYFKTLANDYKINMGNFDILFGNPL